MKQATSLCLINYSHIQYIIILLWSLIYFGVSLEKETQYTD